MNPIHDAAAAGYGARAETYQSGRPSYHPELVRRFVDRFVHGPVLDLGAGTGKFTELIDAAGAEVIAVEPVAAMRALLSERLPDLVALDGSAESIRFHDAAIATIVVAQAFHWFRYGPELDEIARVLRPGGALVTVWNVRDNTVPWVAAYSDVVNRFESDTPRHHKMDWRRTIDRDDRFASIDDWSIDHPVPTDADGVVARALSTSFIAALPPDEQRSVRRDLELIVAPLGDRFDYPYRAEIQAWQMSATQLV